MTTAERNIIIAEFMGGKGNDGDVTYYYGPDGFQHESGSFLKYHSSWDWQIPAWSKAIQEYDLPRKSVYKTRYAVATAMNDIGLGFQILVELITEINQNKKHSLFECTCDRDLKYCKHPDLCESDKL